MRIGSEQQPTSRAVLHERPGIITAQEQTRAESKDTEGQKSDPFAPVDSVTLSKQGLAEQGEQGSLNLDDSSKKQLLELKARDREVRAHEQAHKAAAGDLAVGGPSFEYETGPDNRKYAVGGEVQIQLRDGKTPEETLANMRRAQAAANAPADPSSTDRGVAAKAAQKAAQAQREIAKKRSIGDSSGSEDTESSVTPKTSVDLFA